MDHPPEALLKRVARLCNLISKPELNGNCITVDSYDPTRERFGVTTLQKPTGNDKPLSIWVKGSNIKLLVNPGERRTLLRTGPPPQLVRDAGRYLGQPTQQHRPENLNPTTTAKISNLFLSPDDENSVIIFEDYDFVSDEDGEDTMGLVCTTGHAIAFRRCRFRGDRTSVFVGCFDDRELKDLSEPLDPQLNGNPKVLFESCVFESFKPDTGSACVMVGSSGTATFLNCMFRKCNGGVKVRHGGKADLVHCTITDVFKCGVEVPRYGTCSMLHCLIEKVVCIGAAAMHESNFVIIKSRVEGKMGCYSAGLIFTGKKGAPVIVRDCIVANCVFGIKAELHHVNVTVANTTFINCTKAGVVVNPNTQGTVTVNNCTFHHCNCTVGNASGEQCAVTVDGERQAPNDIPLSQCGCGRCLPCLAANRASKEAGMGTVNCAKCAAAEPMDTKFKSCSKCKNVCYCSRECQTAHWKEHKSICDPRYKYSKLKFDG